MLLDRLGWAVAALMGFLVVVQSARLAWLRGAPQRRLARARARGRAGERQAAALLEQYGYRIEAVQPEIDWTISCDGEPHALVLRADLLVSRDGESFIAEIKTGECAQLDVATTRRQLLEYSVAYPVDGVLLVDADAERVQEVRFPQPQPPPPQRTSGALWLAAAIVTALALWLVRTGSW